MPEARIARSIEENAFVIDDIKALPQFEGVSDETLNAFVQLGNNVVAGRIGQFTSHLYGTIDTDVEAKFGVKKNPAEKTRDYLYRVTDTIAEERTSALKSENKTLKQQIEEGKVDEAIKTENETLKQQLHDAKSETKSWKTKYETDIAAKESEIQKVNGQVLSTKLDYQFAEALQDLKFLPDGQLPKLAKDATIDAAKKTILSETKPEFVEANGKPKLIFRDADGEILRNPQNLNEPYTLAELLTKHLIPILDPGRNATGLGGKAPNPNGQESGQPITVNAKNQSEAHKQISDQLIANGIGKLDPRYQPEMDRIWKENEIGKLPAR